MALKLTGVSHCIPDYTSASMLCVHLACGCQTRTTAKSRPQKFQIQIPPWVFSLLTSNSLDQHLDKINLSLGGFGIHL